MGKFIFKRKNIAILSFFILCGCVRNPYSTTNNSYKKQVKEFSKEIKEYPLDDSINASPYWAGTTNFGLRKPNFVIIHHTDQASCDETLKTFTLTQTKVSAHYVICKDGTIFHMLNDYLRAWHAGASKWGNLTDVNSASIGIELDNDAHSIFPEVQIQSLMELLSALKKKYDLPTANFIGHADVAPGRKVDPSRLFPWKTLAENGFGYWYDTTNVNATENFNALQAMRIIGYNIHDSLNAIQAFKIHFTPNDTTTVLNDGDRKILFSLEKKYQ